MKQLKAKTVMTKSCSYMYCQTFFYIYFIINFIKKTSFLFDICASYPRYMFLLNTFCIHFILYVHGCILRCLSKRYATLSLMREEENQNR